MALNLNREISSFPDPCEKITVTNCEVPASAVTCTTCSNGYFLTEEKVCQLNPYDIIPNCVTYSTFDNCTQCAEGYYITNNGEVCTAHTTAVDNCE